MVSLYEIFQMFLFSCIIKSSFFLALSWLCHDYKTFWKVRLLPKLTNLCLCHIINHPFFCPQNDAISFMAVPAFTIILCAIWRIILKNIFSPVSFYKYNMKNKLFYIWISLYFDCTLDFFCHFLFCFIKQIWETLLEIRFS